MAYAAWEKFERGIYIYRSGLSGGHPLSILYRRNAMCGKELHGQRR